MTSKKTQKSYRELSEELNAIINEFDETDTDIDKALKLHDSATALITELEAYLKKAKNKIEKVGAKKAK